jgi:hypothetical protein
MCITPLSLKHVLGDLLFGGTWHETNFAYKTYELISIYSELPTRITFIPAWQSAF